MTFRPRAAALFAALVLSVSGAAARAADALVVDHDCTDLFEVPESAIEQAKQTLHVAYGHTSHGSQLISGMGTSGGAQLDAFMAANGATPGLYRWSAGGANGDLDLRDRPFSGASDLGNPNRTAWAAATRNYLDAHPEINVVMWSWCGQAATTTENIDTYLDLMEGLIADYPAVRFVFMTGHLDGTGSTGLLHLANEHIRAHCLAHGRILYDFADIESYDPDGLVDYLPLGANDNCDYDSDGNGSRESNWALDWQAAHTEGVDWWASGAAHSQHLNGNRKGYAAWWLLARIAGWGGGSPPPPPSPEAPEVGKARVREGRKLDSRDLTLDVPVAAHADGCRAWEDLPGAEPPDFDGQAPVGGFYRGVSLTLSADPDLPPKRVVCFQAVAGGVPSEVRRVKVRLAAPKVRKARVAGGRRVAGPEVALAVGVRGAVEGWRAWEDLPGGEPPAFTPGPLPAEIEVTLSDGPGLPAKRTILVQAMGAAASKAKRVRVRIE